LPCARFFSGTGPDAKFSPYRAGRDKNEAIKPASLLAFHFDGTPDWLGALSGTGDPNWLRNSEEIPPGARTSNARQSKPKPSQGLSGHPTQFPWKPVRGSDSFPSKSEPVMRRPPQPRRAVEAPMAPRKMHPVLPRCARVFPLAPSGSPLALAGPCSHESEFNHAAGTNSPAKPAVRNASTAAGVWPPILLGFAIRRLPFIWFCNRSVIARFDRNPFTHQRRFAFPSISLRRSQAIASRLMLDALPPVAVISFHIPPPPRQGVGVVRPAGVVGNRRTGTTRLARTAKSFR